MGSEGEGGEKKNGIKKKGRKERRDSGGGAEEMRMGIVIMKNFLQIHICVFP